MKNILLLLIIMVLAAGCHSQTIKIEAKASTLDTPAKFNLQQYRQLFWDSLPKPAGWVNDYENLYSDEQKATLDSIVYAYKAQTGTRIAIVTIDTALVSENKFDNLVLHISNVWGVGEKGKDNGIVIGISRGFRKMRIENGNGIEKLISDDETKDIIDNYFIPSFKKADYYNGTLTGLNRLMDMLNTKRRR